MFDKAEKEYNDLVSKKKIVEADKAKIEEAIRELDEKKNEALMIAYEQVGNDVVSEYHTSDHSHYARIHHFNYYARYSHIYSLTTTLHHR